MAEGNQRITIRMPEGWRERLNQAAADFNTRLEEAVSQFRLPNFTQQLINARTGEVQTMPSVPPLEPFPTAPWAPEFPLSRARPPDAGNGWWIKDRSGEFVALATDHPGGHEHASMIVEAPAMKMILLLCQKGLMHINSVGILFDGHVYSHPIVMMGGWDELCARIGWDKLRAALVAADSHPPRQSSERAAETVVLSGRRAGRIAAVREEAIARIAERQRGLERRPVVEITTEGTATVDDSTGEVTITSPLQEASERAAAAIVENYRASPMTRRTNRRRRLDSR